MAGIHNVFGVVIMSSILAFAVIHLGVAIGIIASDRQHQDIFRPQIGLASFNLVISLLAFLTGVLGMICVLKNADRLGKSQREEKRSIKLTLSRSNWGPDSGYTCIIHHCFSYHRSGDKLQVIGLSQ